ncbi:eCIS core domain-containing protein [Elioraea sp.]|uniref:eCIS core domain-containing protein n=1 Tax=Elioraea sp. TaxID=2185103 RepID=UPI003F6F401B
MRGFAEKTATPGALRAAAAFRIGAANDAAEREADAIAERVLGAATLRRRPSGGGAIASDAQGAVHAALAAPGRPLAASDRARFGTALGVDLAGVRIHDDAAADRAARSVGARAFALGSELVFARGEYRPAEPEGRRLLAHELAHLGQDRSATTVRRENGKGAANKEEEEPSAGDVIVEGLKVAAEKAKDKKEIKEKVLKPIEDKAKSEFGELSTGEKVGVVSFGAATYGLGLGAMFGTAEGREKLSGVNFIAPLGLIPYWPISSFTYTLPEKETDPLKFALKFDGSELLKLGRGDEPKWVTSLSLDVGWTVMPQTDSWKLTKLTGKFGLLPGLTLSGGYQKGPFLTTPSEIVTGPGGETQQSMKTIPSEKGPKDPLMDQPNVGGFITVDLAKLPIVPAPLRHILGGGLGKRRR